MGPQALCEFDPPMQDTFLLKERKEIENRRKGLIYDVSSWNLPMAFGLDSYWAKSISSLKLSSRPPKRAPDLPEMSKHPVAIVVRLADKNELRLSGLLWFIVERFPPLTCSCAF